MDKKGILKRKKEAISKHNKVVIEGSKDIEILERRYIRVIKELKKQRDWWEKNAWKSIFIKIINKINLLRKEVK